MNHCSALEKLCRICGRPITTKPSQVKHQCRDHVDELEIVFGIDVKSDKSDMHPTHFCHPCKTVMHKKMKQGQAYQHRTLTFSDWCEHKDDCTVCEHYHRIQRGGRPRKVKNTPGRPRHTSPKYCIDHIQEVAPPKPEIVITVCEQHPFLSSNAQFVPTS